MNRRAMTAAGSFIVLAPGLVGLTLAMGAPAEQESFSPTVTPGGNVTCRASALRITGEPGGPLADLEIEPFVANEGNDPCTTEDSGVINPAFALPGGLGSVRVLYASTDEAGRAEAGVAQVVLTLPEAPEIRVDLLTSEAAVSCVNNNPEFTSDSRVVRVQVGEDAIELPPDGEHVEVEIPDVLTLHLNESTTGPTADGLGQQRVQQALFLDTPLIDVVIAESIADYRGNPCTGPTTPPPTTPPPTTPPPTTPPPTTPPPTTPPPTAHVPDGWMTGGGRFGAPETETKGSTAHGMVIPCTIGDNPGPNLSVNWPSGHFKLQEITSVRCTNEPGYDPENPSAQFDTVEGTGTGTCQDRAGRVRGPAEIRFRFTDQGEPGRNRDTASVAISGTCQWTAAGTLTPGGNHQAHSPNQAQGGGGSTTSPKPSRTPKRNG